VEVKTGQLNGEEGSQIKVTKGIYKKYTNNIVVFYLTIRIREIPLSYFPKFGMTEFPFCKGGVEILSRRIRVPSLLPLLWLIHCLGLPYSLFFRSSRRRLTP